MCPERLTQRPCTALHKVSVGIGTVGGAIIGGAGGAVVGTAVLPIAGTAGGGAAGGLVGATEGGVLGLAVANVADVGAELIGEGAVQMGKRLNKVIARSLDFLGSVILQIPGLPPEDENPKPGPPPSPYKDHGRPPPEPKRPRGLDIP